MSVHHSPNKEVSEKKRCGVVWVGETATTKQITLHALRASMPPKDGSKMAPRWSAALKRRGKRVLPLSFFPTLAPWPFSTHSLTPLLLFCASIESGCPRDGIPLAAALQRNVQCNGALRWGFCSRMNGEENRIVFRKGGGGPVPLPPLTLPYPALSLSCPPPPPSCSSSHHIVRTYPILACPPLSLSCLSACPACPRAR